MPDFSTFVWYYFRGWLPLLKNIDIHCLLSNGLFETAVLSFQLPQVSKFISFHTVIFIPPPIYSPFGHLMLATDLGHRYPRFRFFPDTDYLFFAVSSSFAGHEIIPLLDSMLDSHTLPDTVLRFRTLIVGKNNVHVVAATDAYIPSDAYFAPTTRPAPGQKRFPRRP